VPLRAALRRALLQSSSESSQVCGSKLNLKRSLPGTQQAQVALLVQRSHRMLCVGKFATQNEQIQLFALVQVLSSVNGSIILSSHVTFIVNRRMVVVAMSHRPHALWIT